MIIFQKTDSKLGIILKPFTFFVKNQFCFWPWAICNKIAQEIQKEEKITCDSLTVLIFPV